MIDGRTHDKDLYLGEDRYANPKEMHRFVVRHARAGMSGDTHYRVLDMGCAAGEFLYCLTKRMPSIQATGVDPVAELLDKAQRRLPGVSFKTGSILDPGVVPHRNYDMVFCLGVLGIFDEFQVPMTNLIRWVRPGGKLFVVWMFNDFPLDVWVRYRHVEIHPEGHREPGWNIISKASMRCYLAQQDNIAGYSFSRFRLPIDLPPSRNDPVRTWTFRDSRNNRLITNGLRLLCDDSLLQIHIKT